MRPPCWPNGAPCPNWCARENYNRTVHNHQHLPGPWQGWRLAGRWLINPAGERIAPHLLDRWLYRHGTMFR